MKNVTQDDDGQTAAAAAAAAAAAVQKKYTTEPSLASIYNTKLCVIMCQ